MQADAGLQLEHAAGIAGSDHVDAKLRNEFGFAVAERSGSVGLHEIVDSRRTAADRRFRNLVEFEAGNAGKQSPGLRAYPLRVLQMA